ncbi:MAG: hypothetical protein LUE17_09950 [Planctomycetaceae bacterium]|nr:hypothetical protein [Planctomycetaceae bacterium]
MFWALISWQSILAGVITALAISIIMAVLGVALGFTVIKPTSNKPFSGLGTAFGIWSAISVLLSLGAGGFVAGMFSGISGREHGFMVWASALIVATLFSSLAFGSAVRGVNSAMKTVGAGMGSLAQSPMASHPAWVLSPTASVPACRTWPMTPSTTRRRAWAIGLTSISTISIRRK